ncbi:MAG TPA: pyrroloquinoline quinone biosynthesis peptide chaperone PqqD [Acetobacteraceae bacterium]|jgi:pyrroloquinoline quinone biosynthesis protein D|nr:pyrroloquinoline quinone biosynthesis peptide chaperone PqqD [Acetobacteraceae bacterium]
MTADVTPDTVPRLARGARLREDAARGRWVVMAPERMFVPDDTALEVLRLMDGTRSIAAIVDDLITRYEAPREEIAADVIGLVQDLAGRGLVSLT